MYTGLPGHSLEEVEQLENFFGSQHLLIGLISDRNWCQFFGKGCGILKRTPQGMLVHLYDMRCSLRLCWSQTLCMFKTSLHAQVARTIVPNDNCSFDSYGLGFSLIGELTHNHQV